jgi:glutathione peroxidase
MKKFLVTLLMMLMSATALASDQLYSLKYTSIQGEPKGLDAFKGKVLLIVNTASECGYTSQYEGLEKLYKKYEAKGLTVIGFPSPSFDQELGSDKEVANFCKLRYGVTFPLAKRVSVKGKDIDPVFSYLIQNAPEKGDVKWNFEKFLINRKGEVVGRFPSGVTPESLASQVEKLL